MAPSILSFFSKKFSSENNVPCAFNIGQVQVDQLSPLGGFHKPATTKAGRLSLAGYLTNGQKVKVYGVFGPEQVALRGALQGLQPIEGLHWPSLLAYGDGLVVEEWIDGVPLNKLPAAEWPKHAEIVQAFLHACQSSPRLQALAAQHQGAFCYIKDYLLPRIQPWTHWQPVAHLLHDWQQVCDAADGKIPGCLSHPDLSLSNLVLQRDTGKLFVIDNELLGVGPGWVLDGSNSFCKRHPLGAVFDEEVQRFAAVSWRLRLVGSALDAGHFKHAAELAMGT